MNDTVLCIIGREKGFLETLFSRETGVDGLEHGFQNVDKRGERRFNKCMTGSLDLGVLLFLTVFPGDELRRQGNDPGLSRTNENGRDGRMGIGDRVGVLRLSLGETRRTGDRVGGDGLGPVENEQVADRRAVGVEMALLPKGVPDIKDQGRDARRRDGIEKTPDMGVGGNLEDPEDRGGIIASEPLLVLPLGIEKGGMLKVKDRKRGEKRIPHLVTSGRMRGLSGIGQRGSQISQGDDDLIKGRIPSLGSFSLPGAR